MIPHLWQSTAFVAVAWLLTLALRKSRAAVRYGIWLAASVKFLIPFSLLVSAGSRFGWLKPRAAAPPRLTFVMEQIGRPFATPTIVPPQPPSHWFEIVLVAVWLSGFAVGVVFWFCWWWRIRAVRRAAKPLDLNLPIPALSSPTHFEPGIFGIRKPVLLLPDGIADRLTPLQLKAVIEHELCHVRRRDNLTAAVHMAVEVIFWFHPLVWWIRERLIEERELACDEEVLRMGNDPEIYAEGILNTCRFYQGSRLACVSGVTGANLKKRIEGIMSPGIARKLNFGKKFLVATVGFATVAVPVTIGILSAPRSFAQSPTAQGTHPEFDVVSIKPYASEAAANGFRYLSVARGRLAAEGTTLPGFIDIAYQVWAYQIVGGPGWINSERYEVTARAEGNFTIEQTRAMVQAMLADRFKLALHRETKELPIYALAAAKNGLKLQATKNGECLVFKEGMPIADGLSRAPPKPYCGQLNGGSGGNVLRGSGVNMTVLTSRLSAILGRSVIDQTGFIGTFNINLRWTPDEAIEGPSMRGLPAPDPDGPSIFTVLQDELGLRLQSGKGPVEIIVIDHVEKPDAN